ncbi:hypothetical protein [Novosphingobium sp. KACC 22771]|uniref:hypothetical protein n=1 Tax=Novosphingobium sp. KACC 22771 TaxID=3025670 RepID=UPI00236670E5|nr:hypothetical protein [Novosphingobium sp. KACC 22771]WDF71281.1 hypothetical protein PQ467_10660 [Novosphingobium sp. KACC 22771]
MKNSLFLLLLLSGCMSHGICDSANPARILAPDREHIAVLVARDCGATSAVSTQIAVQSSGSAPPSEGNVFVADDDHGKAASASWGGPWAEVQWLSSNQLLVRYAAGARIFRRKSAIDGIRIEYQPVVKPPS